LHAAVGVVHQTLQVLVLAVPDGHLERVEGEVTAQGARDTPADDAPGEDVDHEGGIGEARPRRHVGDVGYPELVGPAGHEAPVHQVGRAEPNVSGDSGAALAGPAAALQSHLAHQALGATP
jgi:hypothetical protein